MVWWLGAAIVPIPLHVCHYWPVNGHRPTTGDTRKPGIMNSAAGVRPRRPAPRRRDPPRHHEHASRPSGRVPFGVRPGTRPPRWWPARRDPRRNPAPRWGEGSLSPHPPRGSGGLFAATSVLARVERLRADPSLSAAHPRPADLPTLTPARP
jgi:hypothetical protein